MAKKHICEERWAQHYFNETQALRAELERVREALAAHAIEAVREALEGLKEWVAKHEFEAYLTDSDAYRYAMSNVLSQLDRRLAALRGQEGE